MPFLVIYDLRFQKSTGDMAEIRPIDDVVVRSKVFDVRQIAWSEP